MNSMIFLDKRGDVYEIRPVLIFSFNKCYTLPSKIINTSQVLSERSQTDNQCGIYLDDGIKKWLEVKLQNKEVETGPLSLSSYFLREEMKGKDLIRKLKLKPIEIADLANLLTGQLKLKKDYPRKGWPLSGRNVFLLKDEGEVFLTKVVWRRDGNFTLYRWQLYKCSNMHKFEIGTKIFSKLN